MLKARDMHPEATTSERLPIGVALLIVAVAYGAGIYLLLTAFHPEWRKTLRWARNWRAKPTGPPLSRYSHVAWAALCFIAPVAACSDAFSFPSWLTALVHVLAAVVSALMIGGMIYDVLVWWLRRPA